MTEKQPAISVISERIHPAEIARLMRLYFVDMVKFVADVKRNVIAVGGELQADTEQLLLDAGSQRRDLRGANYYRGTGPDQCIEYTALELYLC